MAFFLPISIKEPVNHALEQLVLRFGNALHLVNEAILQGALLPLEKLLRGAPPALILLLIALLAWHATRRLTHAAWLTGALYLIGCFGLWDMLMQTLALVLVSTVLAVLIGLPAGVLLARLPRLRRWALPVLDVMQTLPTFVYLIPAVMLFGLGKVPAILATVVYAVCPLIRLTELGIRQVDHDVAEAAWSFGTTRWQLLIGVQLPLALPSIMAGLNQTVMMALAMVVIASMIGARGLGEDVLAGIQTLDVGRGLQAGLAIVLLAIVIDRITQGWGRPRRPQRGNHEPH
ncbi:glycine betaine/proline transport system permease protein [Andreprevotia lacus DSM 23236]|jgi:glycine betaine/proline transport system permease protein|uniref:Glycine betaine/proline transport system permease protein n=1 Tax=Andreprevotia lacus DSM 23236 TaxID=1121001 RepID=A0A1W1XZ70_9NEIS|nr:ABC transporter permease subunit [Andreprevotia lacus]SMC29269.1 glycine betaine/proline transport system permease protein [Andreprevotia lacus DSM 23236]